jgi:hypothetical protein
MLDCTVTARNFLRVKIKLKAKVNVKKFLYVPGKTLRVPGGRGTQTSRQSAHEGGKLVSPKHLLHLPPGNIPGAHFC